MNELLLANTDEKKQRVDREHSIVYGIKILGFNSQNNRVYERKAIKEAIHLYDNCPVNRDHSVELPSFSDRIGWLSHPRLEGDGLYADLHYNPHAEGVDSFLWFAENDGLGAIGFSHMVQGKWTLDADGTERVVRIDRVKSVDLVANPATTKGIFESVELTKATEPTEKVMDSKNIMKEENPIKDIYQNGGDVVTPTDATAPAADQAKAEPNLELLNQLMSIVSGDGSNEEKGCKVLEILGLKPEVKETTDVANTSKTSGTPPQAKLADKEDPADEAEDRLESVVEKQEESDIEKMRQEIIALKACISGQKRRERLDKLLAENQLEATPIFIRQLTALGEGEWEEAINDRKRVALIRNSVKPVSSIEIRGESNYKQFVESVLGK